MTWPSANSHDAQQRVPSDKTPSGDDMVARRTQVLADFGASGTVLEELLRYGQPQFGFSQLPPALRFPLADEPSAPAWDEYAGDVAAAGDIRILADRLVQLSFPVRAGMSEESGYRAATRRGVAPGPAGLATGIELEFPQRCQLGVFTTWAGRIPVLMPHGRADFITLVRALTAKNEPVPVPPSMGACIVANYNNLARYNQLRAAWSRDNPNGTFSPSAVAHLRPLYQDTFILLSDGDYSAVAGGDLNLDPSEWRQTSIVIRREHEFAHYWTRRVLGSMRNCVLDELIADYCGILAACGEFRPDWMLRFFGLEARERYRAGGRLENYLGEPSLSEDAFTVLGRMVRAAVGHLAAFSRDWRETLASSQGTLYALLTLTRVSLEDLASGDAKERLPAAMSEAAAFAGDRAQQRSAAHEESVVGG